MAKELLFATVKEFGPAVSTHLNDRTIYVDSASRELALAEVSQQPKMYVPYDPFGDETDSWKRNQYAIAVSFCVALSGKPDLGTNRGDADHDNWAQDWKAPATATVQLPPDFDKLKPILAKMLGPSADRYAGVQDALDAITKVPVPEKGLPIGLIAGGFVVAAVVVGGLVFFKPPSVPPATQERSAQTAPVSAPTIPNEPPRKDMAKVGNFWLDRAEVVISAYEAWAAKNGKPSPFAAASPQDKPDPSLPVWNVGWADAGAYCGSLGKRLPSTAEWQQAWDTAKFPWTGTPPADVHIETGQLAKGCSSQSDKTAAGICDLAGNLPEWTSDDDGTGRKVVRGGAFYLPASTSAARFTMGPVPEPGRGELRVGFRCAADPAGTGTK